jgi:hypothetical protein
MLITNLNFAQDGYFVSKKACLFEQIKIPAQEICLYLKSLIQWEMSITRSAAGIMLSSELVEGR